MTTEALDIYRLHLNEQLGENSPVTTEATLDPSGEDEVTLYGIFEENTFRSGSDTANQFPKRSGARFIVPTIENFDIYENKEIVIPYYDKRYTVNFIETDENGAQVLWLL